jgi:hypothetical protein
MTWKMTMSIASRRDPAVLPMGRNGTEGKTANTQKITKQIEPRITSLGYIAIATDQLKKLYNLLILIQNFTGPKYYIIELQLHGLSHNSNFLLNHEKNPTLY